MNKFEQTETCCPFNFPTGGKHGAYLCINEIAIARIGLLTDVVNGQHGAPFSQPCVRWRYGRCCERGYITHVPDRE